jgi:phosphoesterase RecJ-like protein
MDWNKAKNLLESAQRIVVLTHVSPDGDAIGTLLGVGHTLRQLGKSVTLTVDEGVPPHLRFLPGAADVLPKLEPANIQADLVIAVDCGDEMRMGNVGKSIRALGVPLINIDHHHTNTLFGDVNLVIASAVAAAEVALDWFDAMDVEVTQDTAQCLLCGIVTDTICFRTDNTTATTLAKAQRLIELGGNLSFIVRNSVSRIQTSTIKLWAQIMPTVQIQDHVIWVKISLEARQATNHGDKNDGGLPSLLLQADDAYISCVFKEKENNEIEISLRAEPGLNVSQVATSIGGGGHVLAAGATVKGTLEEVEARVIPLLKEAAKLGTPVYA